MGGRGGGAGGRGVAGAWFGASTPGAEGSQALRHPFREDEFLPQLQVGATTSCRETEDGKTSESACLCQFTVFLQQGAAEAASRVRERVSASFGCRHQSPCMFHLRVHVSRAGVWRGGV